ncbi:MAG: ABC transporter permease, partial [Defluviitaleaceae bacterium]|nr:ABC transporter permease [Defluviitaleaceae bacterium]
TMTVHTGLLLVFFLACFFMWLFMRSRLGMMMSAAGANPSYARASGINVEKMRILGTAISTALGAVGIIVYAQAFGFLQLYTAPLFMGFTAVASVLIGGATVRRARVFDVLVGAFLFNGILTIALPLINVMMPDVAGVPEMLRLIVTNGIILYALSKAKGGR